MRRLATAVLAMFQMCALATKSQTQRIISRALMLLMAVISLVSVSPVWAQHVTNDDLIHGGKNPELISDRVAIRLYLEMMSHKVGTNEDLLRIRLENSGLRTDADIAVLESIVRDFTEARNVLLKVEDGAGDQLTNDVDAKVSTLLGRLSLEAKDRFTAFIQQEKRGMSVSPYDVGLSTSVRQNPNAVLNASLHPVPQSQGGMTPNYSIYMPSPTVDHHGNFFGELQVSGSTTCNPGAICFQGQHKPSVTLTYGSYGGTAYGAPGYPGQYIQAFINVNFSLNTLMEGGGPTDLSGNDTAAVFCTQLGHNIFSGSGLLSSYFGFEPAVTLTQEIAIPPMPGPRGKNYYSVTYFCTAASAPPDWQPKEVLATSTPDFTLGLTVCTRIPDQTGVPWFCAATAAEIMGVDPLYVGAVGVQWFGEPYNCTNHDRGFSGSPITWPF